MTLNCSNHPHKFSLIVAALAISELNNRAGLLYCYAGEFVDVNNGAIASYGLVAACAECAGICDEFRAHYGPSSDWEGCGIDFGELIHWAHSLG
jgi:hypothetical protein